MDKTIRRYTDFEEMKADEYRYWQSRPVYERVAAVSELTQEHYALKGAGPDVPEDFKELLSVLNEHRVKYLVVGAYAVSIHAQPPIAVPVWRSRAPRSVFRCTSLHHRRPASVEAVRGAGGAPALLKRGDVGVVERRNALEHDGAYAFLQMEDLAGAAEFCADPLPRQHLARRHDDSLLMVGIEMGLDRIADDDDGAILQARGGRPVDLVDVGHLDAGLRLRPRLPLRMELPQFVDELAAERIARAEAADLGVGPRALIDPIFEALELVEVGARRARQPGDRREVRADSAPPPAARASGR